jgi:DNA-binding transcriptional regulator YbjK
VARTVAEVVNGTAVASAAVFSVVGALADAAAVLASPASSSSPEKRLPLVNASSRSSSKTPASEEQREAAALGKLQELEQCIGELESESEKVFRSLVQTRVSLLNIHTPTF